MNVKEKFYEIVENIKRDGIKDLLKYLETTDYFVAPASTKFHSNVKGGLLKHSINVYERFLKIIKDEYGDNWEKVISHESIIICGLFHDLCKVNYFKEDYKNVKENGVWTQVPFFTVDDNLPFGHGEKSVYILNSYIRLTREEAMAINWHMGGFDTRVKGGSYSLSDAFYKYPTSLLFHIADLEATYLDEMAE